jgi:hypothetical protein
VLHTLAGLTPAQFKKHVAAGKIHRKLCMKDARALLPEGRKLREVPAGKNVINRLNSIGTLIKALNKSDAELPDIKAKLQEFTDYLASILTSGNPVSHTAK